MITIIYTCIYMWDMRSSSQGNLINQIKLKQRNSIYFYYDYL